MKAILKTITWRVIATGTTVALVYAFTGQIKIAAGLGILEVIAKMILYYLHERMWQKWIPKKKQQ